MKKATVEIIEKKFSNELDEISYEIFTNKNIIKTLSEKQRELKDTRKGLFELLQLIRGKNGK